MRYSCQRCPAAPEKGGETPLKKKNLDNQRPPVILDYFLDTKTLRKAVLQTKAKFLAVHKTLQPLLAEKKKENHALLLRINSAFCFFLKKKKIEVVAI